MGAEKKKQNKWKKKQNKERRMKIKSGKKERIRMKLVCCQRESIKKTRDCA